MLNKHVAFERRFKEIEKSINKNNKEGKSIEKLQKEYEQLQKEYDVFIRGR